MMTHVLFIHSSVMVWWQYGGHMGQGMLPGFGQGLADKDCPCILKPRIRAWRLSQDFLGKGEKKMGRLMLWSGEGVKGWRTWRCPIFTVLRDLFMIMRLKGLGSGRMGKDYRIKVRVSPSSDQGTKEKGFLLLLYLSVLLCKLKITEQLSIENIGYKIQSMFSILFNTAEYYLLPRQRYVFVCMYEKDLLLSVAVIANF